MEVNSVSTQLHRLHLEGLVDKVDVPGESRQGFQVSERFFNLWYLMRASRRHRGRVFALARCLETLYDIGDLEALGKQLPTGDGEADFTMATAQAIGAGGMQRERLGQTDPVTALRLYHHFASLTEGLTAQPKPHVKGKRRR